MRIRVGPVEKLGSITNDSYESWERYTVANAIAKLGKWIMQSQTTVWHGFWLFGNILLCGTKEKNWSELYKYNISCSVMLSIRLLPGHASSR